eukprot:TRINITY_DN23321_c0_g2_i2.p1 TRINITY_DN23321_c0_g2~~TRINITY_DN23321_c0_g2_i2.p1  ORF type:complete len:834 (-),score=141.38 TRINITY_DN23321_c0_g2_i2:61-2526(-)
MEQGERRGRAAARQRRIDPADGQAYTWKQLKDYYSRWYEESAIRSYWEQCSPTTGGAAPAQPRRGRTWLPKAGGARAADSGAAGESRGAEVEVSPEGASADAASSSQQGAGVDASATAGASTSPRRTCRAQTCPLPSDRLSDGESDSDEDRGSNLVGSDDPLAREDDAAAGNVTPAWSRRRTLVGTRIMEEIQDAEDDDDSEELPAPCRSRFTQYVADRVREMDACPIGLTLMLNPTRVVHDDEAQRQGMPLHIMGRDALDRWLATCREDPRCPLCRGRVVRTVPDDSVEQQLAESLQALAREQYTGGERVAHKAVKLLDSQLLVALGCHLDMQAWRDIVLQENEAGQEPFELLASAGLSERQWAEFCEGFPPLDNIVAHSDDHPVLVYSESSAAVGGSALWQTRGRLAPVPNRAILLDAFGNRYRMLHVGPATSTDETRWGSALFLCLSESTGQNLISAWPIKKSLIAGLVNGGMDEEVFEPAIRIRAGTKSAVFKGRVAAQRGIWIGGVKYFDDFVLDAAVGAAALVLFDPETRCWRFLPEASFTGEERTLSCCDSEIACVRIAPGPVQSLELEPCFTARRRCRRDGGDNGAQDDLPAVEPAISLADARRLRGRLVLVQLRAEVRPEPGNPGPTLQIEQLGAVVSEFIIGRQEGCAFELPRHRAELSRSHCVLRLQETTCQRGGRLLAYDDGSLCGTLLQGRPLGVGVHEAQEIQEGDCLRLGPLVSVHVSRISPALQLDDNAGLAAFFERLGQRSVATSLRLGVPRRRATEALLSSSLTSSWRLSTMPAIVGGPPARTATTGDAGRLWGGRHRMHEAP